MKKLLTFCLKKDNFAIDIDLVKGITRNVEYTPLLGTKGYIKGLMNLRGNIITIFDLYTLLSYDGDERNKSSKCVVLKPYEDNNDQIGFLVEKTGDVIEVNDEKLYELPGNYGQAKKQYISNIIKFNNELISIVDFKKIFEMIKIQEGI